MAKDKLTDYDSSTASNNTDVGGISVAEGMLPSAVNNSLRELTKQLGAFADGTDGIDVLSLADDDASHAIKLQAPSAVTANTTFTLPDGDGTADQVLKTDGAGQLGFADRHSNPSLIINGCMQVAQRGTSGTTNTGYNSVDRFATQAIATDNLAMTLTQQTDSPAGFSNSLKLTVTTAESALASDEFFSVQHRIEAQNLQSLQYGASGAKSLTLSFYVKGTTTGTYTVALQQIDGARVITSTYAISSANTWEKKTLTFTGDTSGSFANDNGEGLRIYWFLAAGSDYTSVDSTAWSAYADNKVAYGHAVNIIDSTSKTWQLAGVKLEVGSTATDFQHRSFGDELARCQRYFSKSYDYADAPATATQIGAMYDRMGAGEIVSNRAVQIQFPVDMRGAPAVTAYSLNGTSGAISDCGTGYSHVSDDTGAAFNGTDGNRGISKLQGNDSDSMIGFHFTADAEL